MDVFRMVLFQYLMTFGWAVVGAVGMGVGLAVAFKIFTALTPNIDEVEELKKGNVAVAIVLAAVVISMGVVVAVIASGS